MHDLPELKQLKSARISPCLSSSSHTRALPSFPLVRTHVLALTRTQSCQEPLDHSHLQKEVPAEARESQSETKGRRTAEGEERIRSGSRKERRTGVL
ncbi:hypothetical protein FQA47_006453 [Oryzias melastigma]|uniref:Uncharacterized protein n=1 Tax=Oryzias melastigma TaxID=30732 RepID=A0A834BWY7_ORYME|nr:hypothetical protein FQA47_006453 [Oryzias melastigma]